MMRSFWILAIAFILVIWLASGLNREPTTQVTSTSVPSSEIDVEKETEESEFKLKHSHADDSVVNKDVHSRTLDKSQIVSKEPDSESAEKTRWLAKLPPKHLLAAEVNANPHGMPKSLSDIASSFAKEMELAKQSEQAAIQAFDKFASCAEDRDRTYVMSLRMTCYLNAKKLAQIHPKSIAPSFDEFSRSIDHELSSKIKDFESL